MFKSLIRHCTVYVMITALTVLMAMPVHASGTALQAIPSDSLVCLRINNLNQTLTQTDQFLAGVSPMGVSMFARMGLANVLGSSSMTGVDMNGDFAVFVIAKPGSMVPVTGAVLVPVTDYSQFISGSTNCTQADSDGISRLTAQGMPPLLIANVGKFALIGAPDGDKQSFMQLKNNISAKSKSLSTKLSTKLAADSGKKPLWLYVNMQQVNKNFGPMIQMQLQQMQGMMAGMPKQKNTLDPAAAVKSVVEIFNMVLTQSQHVTVSLDPSAAGLHLNRVFTALKGTELAKNLSGSITEKNNLLGYFDSNAAVNVSYNLNKDLLKSFMDWSMKLNTAMLKDTMDSEKLSKMKELAAESLDIMGSCGVFSVSAANGQKPAFAVQAVYNVKDAAKYQELMKKGMDMNAALFKKGVDNGTGVNMQMDFKINAQKYKGLDITESNFIFKVKNADSGEAKIIKSMYGNGFNTRIAVADKNALLAMGSSSDKIIRKLIDQKKAGNVQISSGIKTAMALIPYAEKADFFATVNGIKMYEIISQMSPKPMPKVDVPAKSCMVMAAKTSNGKAEFDLVLPKAHLTEIMQLVRTMTMQNMR